MTNTESLLLDNQRLIMVALHELLGTAPKRAGTEGIRMQLENRMAFVDTNTKTYFENLDRLGVAP